MTSNEPAGTIDARFGDEGVGPTPWADVRSALEQAELYWLSTVKTDGRPHVTPLIGVFVDDTLHFCTGETEQKAKNLAANARCTLTTGQNTWASGLDVVVDGEAVNVADHDRLQQLAEAYEAKYGSVWHFDVVDRGFDGGGGRALVFAVQPSAVFAFGKSPHSQTRFDPTTP